MMKFHSSFSTFIITIFLCNAAIEVKAQDVIIYKAKKIYTADTSFRTAEAMAVSGGRILATGDYRELKSTYRGAKTINYKNKFIYPGFIDAHSHFLGYAKGLKECNLVGTSSAEDVVATVKKFASSNSRDWIVGRGWDQNDWANKDYPDIALLDAAFPNKPVFLQRIDGHAAWINSAAVKALNLDIHKKIGGGEIVMKDGKFTGILIDNAVDLASSEIPPMAESMLTDAVDQAAKNCYRAGLTTVTDAGIQVKDFKYLYNLQTQNKLDLRIYAMLTLNNENLAWISENGVFKSERMHVAAVKFYLDGALGSRGALLKQDYCDQPGYRGLMTSPTGDLFMYSHFLLSRGFQVCVHAIGDSANRIALETFYQVIPPTLNPRWRIEHAQIIDPADFHYFRDRLIIPSVQPTHATSDAPWALQRICENRIPGAYAYETLRQQAGIVALGTDFPVEDISPIKTFYSAVTRLDAEGKLKEPFIPRQGLTREATLWGMTLWAAYASFEEAEKGSLEAKKLADFVVTKGDLMTVPDKQIPKVTVVATFIAGNQVFKK